MFPIVGTLPRSLQNSPGEESSNARNMAKIPNSGVTEYDLDGQIDFREIDDKKLGDDGQH